MSDLWSTDFAVTATRRSRESVDNLVSEIAKKGSQVRGGGVVVDLSRSPFSPGDLANVLRRVQGVTPNISDITYIN